MLSLIKKNTLLIISLIFISLFFVKNNIFVDTAQKYTAEIAKDSAAVYVSLRLLNAALSFAQEIEVTGSVVIASGTIKPFKPSKKKHDHQRLFTTIMRGCAIKKLAEKSENT